MLSPFLKVDAGFLRFQAQGCHGLYLLPYKHHLYFVLQVAMYITLTARPSVNSSPVNFTLWQFSQEGLLGTIFPEFLLIDGSLSAVLILESKFSWINNIWLIFSFLEYLKYVIPLSPDIRCCCQEIGQLSNFLSFLSDLVLLPGSSKYFSGCFGSGHPG